MLRVMSNQKLPIDEDCRRTKPRINATRTAMPEAADRKFCTASPSICDKITERRFAAVALPVRVRGEAHGRVERQVGRRACHVLRIQRQIVLQPQQAVDDQQAQEVDRQHRIGVVLPRHLGGRIDAAQPINQPFERAQNLVQAARLVLVDPGHEERPTA